MGNSANGKKWNLKKHKTKETPFSEHYVRQSIEPSSLSFGTHFGTEHGIVPQRTFFSHREMDSLPLWSIQHAIMTLNNLSGIEIMTSENVNHVQVSCSLSFM